MNQEEALIHLRGIVQRSPELTQCASKVMLHQHQKALKVLDKLIAQRTAKRLWRDGKGEEPLHMRHPGHPLNKARR